MKMWRSLFAIGLCICAAELFFPFGLIAGFSEKLERLAATPVNDREELIQSLISEGTPLVNGTEVTFLAQSREGKAPVLLGDFNWWGRYPKAEGIAGGKMILIAGTDLYFATSEFSLDARIEYGFSDDQEERWIDPLNNRGTIQTFGQTRSFFEMPEYSPPHSWISWNGAKYKNRLHTFVMQKETSEKGRKVHVFLPEKYPDDAPYPVAYFNDGSMYADELSVPSNIDFLIQNAVIRPIIGVFVNPVNRSLEYRGQREFLDYFTNELVPYIDHQYKTFAALEGRAIIGGSRGGRAALHLAYNTDNVFKYCGMLEPAITPNNILSEIFNGPTKPIHFNVVGGTYDPRFVGDYHNVVDTLLNKGYSLNYQTVPIGHSPNSWKYHIPQMLMDFFPPKM